MTETEYKGYWTSWKGCCLKSRLWNPPALREHVNKYGNQFATFVEHKGKTVVIKVAGKEVEISKEQFEKDWVID